MVFGTTTTNTNDPRWEGSSTFPIEIQYLNFNGNVIRTEMIMTNQAPRSGWIVVYRDPNYTGTQTIGNLAGNYAYTPIKLPTISNAVWEKKRAQSIAGVAWTEWDYSRRLPARMKALVNHQSLPQIFRSSKRRSAKAVRNWRRIERV